MIQFWLFIFLFSCFIVFYNYAGYAIIVFFLNKLKRKNTDGGEVLFFPSISFIVAAFNEEDCIEQKILNSLEQDYPADKIEFIFVSDGSSDGTREIIEKYPRLISLYDAKRGGKPAAMNRGIQYARGEVLIFSDANTILNKDAILHIARHYADPRTGGVAGEKKVLSATNGNKHQVGEGEGMYWKYESYLKKLDSEFYSVVGAAGELFSVRKDLYEPIPKDAILDDFVISLKVAQKGYRIIYEPNACATELPSFSMKDEKKRKVRIAAGGFQSIVMLKDLLLFWKQPKLSFLYISHRVLRWAATPFCLILALLANTVLALQQEQPVYRVLLAGQLLFYGMALAARASPQKIGSNKWFKLPYYFVFMNVSVIQGLFRFLKGGQSILWDKAKRSTALTEKTTL